MILLKLRLSIYCPLKLLKFLFIILPPTQSHGLIQLLQKCLQTVTRPDGCSYMIICGEFRDPYTSNQDLLSIWLP